MTKEKRTDRDFSQAWWPRSIEDDGDLINDPAFDFDEASPWRVTAYWEKVGEKMEPVEVVVRTVRPDLTGPIGANTFREIPIGLMLRQARFNFVQKLNLDATAWRQGKPRLGREHYEEVAQVYRKAYGLGQSPTQAVREHFNVSQSTAAKYVARARNEYGLLPKVEQGKAGI